MPDEGFLGESLRKIAKGAGVSFAGVFAGLALGYLSRMIIARWLGTSDYGLISLGYAAIILLFHADWVSIRVFHSPELTPVLRIFSIAIPFSVLANNLISATIGFQDIRYRVYANDLFQNIS